jgi:hypothetical protein
MSESLNGTPKYQTLQTAAKDLVNEVLTNPDVDSNTAIGIVPFATYLRVEPRYWQEDWLRVPSAWSSAGNRCTYPHKRGCRMMPGGSIPCVIDGVSTTCPYDPYETCTDWGQPFCFNDPGQIYTFGGCFSSRPGSLDRIDRLPGPYQGRSPFWDYASQRPCAQVPMLDLTKSGGRTALLARIDALTPAPNNDTVTDTYTSGGMEFAWQMLTPGLPFDTTMDAADAETIGLTKAVVLMTDGVNNSKPYLPACSPNCPGLPTDPLRDNQLLWHVSSCRGNMCARMEPRKSADDATKSLCTKIKGDGILIFTVALNINDVDARDMLRTCASKPEYFFEAGSRTALLDAFKRIGAQLRNIRIVN